jgi:uncharacterized membrane protein
MQYSANQSKLGASEKLASRFPLLRGATTMTSHSKEICASILSLIALTDLSIILDIPVLRQVLGFVLLTFLPGFLLVLILNLTKTESLEKILFSLGLSIAFLMFIPFLMNLVYPGLGISRPISLLPMTATFSLILVALTIIAYQRGALELRVTLRDARILLDQIMSPPVLGAALILVLGILGGVSAQFYNNTLFSLVAMLGIAIAVILIATNRIASERFYPFYILAIAMALLYSRALASPNLFGSDIHYELYIAELVKSGGYWSPGYGLIPGLSDYSAMFSVAFLPNVYSILLNASTVSVYKLIFPVIFAFVPLGLYQLYRTQMGNRIKFLSTNKFAFLSAFVFMSFYAFLTTMLALPRQQIAELFLVLGVLLITKVDRRNVNASGLLLVFLVSMVASHYATAYLFLFMLAIAWGGILVIASRNSRSSDSALSFVILAFCFIVTLGWYIYVASGAAFESLLSAIVGSYKAAFSGLFDFSQESGVATALGTGIYQIPLTHTVGRYWQIGTQVLVLGGLAYVVLLRNKLKINRVFLLFSFASFLILAAIIVVPFAGGTLKSYRIYSLTLIFLAPFCLIGLGVIIDSLSNWFGAKEDVAHKLKLAAVISLLIPYFLLSSYSIFELTEHPSNYLTSSSLQSKNVSASEGSWSYLVQSPIPNQDVFASTWFSTYRAALATSASASGIIELVGYGGVSPSSVGGFYISRPIDTQSYVYLASENVQKGTILSTNPRGVPETVPISSLTAPLGRVYSNGGAEIYYHP